MLTHRGFALGLGVHNLFETRFIERKNLALCFGLDVDRHGATFR